MSVPWLIFLSFSGAEWAAYRGLLRQGIEAYYPYFFETARHGRWQQPVGKPQFPGYLFARHPLAGLRTVVERTAGIRNVLTSGGNVVCLTDQQFEEIKQRCDKTCQEGMPKPDEIRILQIGDAIEVPYGPFVGAPAIIRTIDNSGRIEAQLGPFTITCSLSELAPANVPSVRVGPKLWPRAAAHD